MTMLITGSPSTIQIDNEEPASTLFALLQDNIGPQENDNSRHSIFHFIEKLYPAVKRRLKMKILLGFAVDKHTWIQTLKHMFPQFSKYLHMPISRIRTRGGKLGASLQRRRVAQPLPNVMKSPRARLKFVTEAAIKKSRQGTYRYYSQVFLSAVPSTSIDAVIMLDSILLLL